MQLSEEDYLAHYGVIRRSGRYPWGSGGNVEYIRNKRFPDFVKQLKEQGMTESKIAQGFGMTVNQLRATHSIESNANRQANINMAQRLQDKGYSPTAIGTRMKVPESTVRSWLAPGAKDKADVLTNTANELKKHVDEKGLLDVGKGVEQHLGVTRTRMDTAIEVLKQQGYVTHTIRSPQTTNQNRTNMIVLAPPGTEWKYVVNNQDKIQQVSSFSTDGGRSFGQLHEPLSIHPNRIQVVYGPDGGAKADGMIYIRPGVDDVSIGGNKYAQVRVAVGKDHFLKGMAMYKDDLPAGVDLQFHTNKKDTGNKLDAMKKNTEDKAYVEGGPHPILKSVRRQIIADPGTSKERVTSVMNLVDEEGKWETWSKSMSSQMLSKQSPVLAKSQLDMTYEQRVNELNTIRHLSNATVRKKLLQDFADSTDAAAVHLHAAALPRTGTHVILPIASMPKNQIYAPNYNHGEKVVLIRHPHGGVFEIPELTVNNRQKEAKSLLGESRDAVGIHHSVAAWLSGADFDGDTVLVIPNNNERIRHTKALSELKNFDPVRSYPGYPGMKKMRNTQTEMGMISNLITDMSIKGAPHDEIARAVKHSMVVIDAEKHGLDYKASFNDNGIKQLKQKYQSGGGAATIISRAGSETRIPQRVPRPRPLGGPINPKTGALEFVPTNRVHWKTGKPVMTRYDRLAVTNDARQLMSTKTGTPMERLYADHSNRLKSLANQARLDYLKTPTPKQSSSARKAYKSEYESLKSKLAIAERNAPLERQANLIANATVKMRKDANPNMDPDTLKKIEYQALVQARVRVGAKKDKAVITDKEWEAIQAGAISSSMLTKLLNNADMEVVKKHAMPRDQILMTPSKTARAKQMLELGYSRSDVANQLGVSLSTLDASTV